MEWFDYEESTGQADMRLLEGAQSGQGDDFIEEGFGYDEDEGEVDDNGYVSLEEYFEGI